jgi:competence protein ComEC
VLPLSGELARCCFDEAAWGGEAVVLTARIAAQPTWAEIAVVNPGGWVSAALAALPLLPVLPRPQRTRALAAVLALIVGGVGYAAWQRYRGDATDLVFASVGQGDATIVRLAGGKVLLVDGGPPGRGHSVVAPLLRRMSIARIDYVVATHVQDDHWGGLADLAEERGIEIGELWYPGGRCTQERFRSFAENLTRRGTRVHEVGSEAARRAGEGRESAAITRRGSGWRVRALWPSEATGKCDDNDRSVVVLVRFGRARVLLTGDIERGAEERLAGRRPCIRATLLKAPHHGSRTSSSDGLLDAVRPKAALASCGIANRYGFPHPEVLRRYAARGVRLYRTDLDGALSVRAYRDRIVLAPVAGPQQVVAIPRASRRASMRPRHDGARSIASASLRRRVD